MVGKGHILLYIRFDCFMLVFPFLFLSLHKIVFNECVVVVVVVVVIRITLVQLGVFLPIIGYVTPALVHIPYSDPQSVMFL